MRKEVPATEKKIYIDRERFKRHIDEYNQKRKRYNFPKLTYKYISDKMYLGVRTLKYYASGEKPIPPYHLETLCKIIDCVPEWLTGEAPEDAEHFLSETESNRLNEELEKEEKIDKILANYLYAAGYAVNTDVIEVNGVAFDLDVFEDYIEELKEMISYVTARYAYNVARKEGARAADLRGSLGKHHGADT